MEELKTFRPENEDDEETEIEVEGLDFDDLIFEELAEMGVTDGSDSDAG